MSAPFNSWTCPLCSELITNDDMCFNCNKWITEFTSVECGECGKKYDPRYTDKGISCPCMAEEE